MNVQTINSLGRRLMQAVIDRLGPDFVQGNADLAVEVMRRELKLFLCGAKYANERALIEQGREGLAWDTLAAECCACIAEGAGA